MVLGVLEVRSVVLCLLLLHSLGCASNVNGTKAGILTVVVAGEKVFVGRARTFGTDGTFLIRSLEAEPIECTGRFRYNTANRHRTFFVLKRRTRTG